MRTLIVLAGLAVLSIPAVARPQDVDSEKMKLQGTWKMEGMYHTVNGQTRNSLKPNGTNAGIAFSGNGFTLKSGANEKPGEYSIDPSKSPKEMDWRVKNPQGEELVHRAAYEVAGDELTIVFGFPPKGQNVSAAPRPQSLEPADNVVVYKCKRVAQ